LLVDRFHKLDANSIFLFRSSIPAALSSIKGFAYSIMAFVKETVIKPLGASISMIGGLSIKVCCGLERRSCRFFLDLSLAFACRFMISFFFFFIEPSPIFGLRAFPGHNDLV